MRRRKSDLLHRFDWHVKAKRYGAVSEYAGIAEQGEGGDAVPCARLPS
jgi:hypothetical protein